MCTAARRRRAVIAQHCLQYRVHRREIRGEVPRLFVYAARATSSRARWRRATLAGRGQVRQAHHRPRDRGGYQPWRGGEVPAGVHGFHVALQPHRGHAAGSRHRPPRRRPRGTAPDGGQRGRVFRCSASAMAGASTAMPSTRSRMWRYRRLRARIGESLRGLWFRTGSRHLSGFGSLLLAAALGCRRRLRQLREATSQRLAAADSPEEVGQRMSAAAIYDEQRFQLAHADQRCQRVAPRAGLGMTT